MLQPENQSKKYQYLFTGIDTGKIKIPMFQREFVWSKEQTAKLIDSIIKGYPIGTFILWRTNEELRYVKNIGNVTLPDPPKGDYVEYILDGQQRITSLYALQKGIIFNREGVEIDYKDISIDLNENPDEEDQIVFVNPHDCSMPISVFTILNASIADLVAQYPEKGMIDKISLYKTRLTGYDFSTVQISNYPIDIACEIFTRINTSGTELTLFEIMVAKTYDQDRKFDLAKEYNLLLDNNGTGKDLEDAGYETLPASAVLQCISAHICQQAKRKDILKLSKNEIIDQWPEVKHGIFTAVDYFRSHFRVPVSRLLPYYTLIVPFSYFFLRLGKNKPSLLQNKLLVQYFWWASLSQRFSSGVEGKIALDLKRMDDIINGQVPEYRKDEEIHLTLDELTMRWFSTGDSFCKALLCLMTSFHPKSFMDNSDVQIDNSWLKIVNSKNYHHFFPRAYLRDQHIPDWKANVILNITIVDDYINKREIGKKPPGVYLKKFLKQNDHFSETMKSHLIDNPDMYGVWDNDYEKYLRKRGMRVIKEIEKRLYPKL
jgi:hypothetical protein